MTAALAAAVSSDKGFGLKLVIFSAYVGLFVNQAILVKISVKDGKYTYNTTTVVLLSEFCKLIIAVLFSINTHSFSVFTGLLRSNVKLCLLYFIPSILYSFHNNLSFVSLSHTDPATYYVLLQLRVLVTGVVFQILFKRRLNLLQWTSLLILFFGCLIKEFDNMRGSKTHVPTAAPGGVASESKPWISFYVLVILFQVLCSCLAGVYTEYLLKKQGSEVSVHIQNVFMYVDSIICNLTLLICMGKYDALTGTELAKIWSRPGVVAIVINGALGGLMTAFLLKYLNSIMKVFANSVEILLVAFVGALLLNIPISMGCVAAMVLVCGALVLYWYGGETAGASVAPVQSDVESGKA